METENTEVTTEIIEAPTEEEQEQYTKPLIRDNSGNLLYNNAEDENANQEDSKPMKSLYKCCARSSLNLKDLSPKNNLIIFDWDDTLMCSTFLVDSPTITEENKKEIKDLETNVIKLLDKCINHADVYIITNSEDGWVKESTNLYYPNLEKEGLLNKLTIISSKAKYSYRYPSHPKYWKILAFNDILDNYDTTIETNIISIGDNFNDLKASKNLAKKFPNSYLKAIKFKEFPKISEMIKENDLVINQFDYIFKSKKNWNIRAEKKNKK